MRRATIQLWADHLAGDESALANWNGGFWDDTARAAGLAVGTIPVAGAIVTFDPGTQGITAATGHVAFVESVSADGSFVVSEMNAPLPYRGHGAQDLGRRDRPRRPQLRVLARLDDHAAFLEVRGPTIEAQIVHRALRTRNRGLW